MKKKIKYTNTKWGLTGYSAALWKRSAIADHEWKIIQQCEAVIKVVNVILYEQECHMYHKEGKLTALLSTLKATVKCYVTSVHHTARKIYTKETELRGERKRLKRDIQTLNM